MYVLLLQVLMLENMTVMTSPAKVKIGVHVPCSDTALRAVEIPRIALAVQRV